MDLTPSLELAQTGDTFSVHHAISFLLIIIAGAVGGIANAYFASRQSGQPEDWRWHCVASIIIAFTAPLFLHMLDSRLLESVRLRTNDYFAFAAFCLLYVMAVRRLIDNPWRACQEKLTRLTTEITVLRQAIDSLQHDRLESEAALAAAKDALTYHDLDLLRTLEDENYVYGNIAALAEKTGLGRELVGQRLIILKNLGFIDTRIGEKNMLHWVISSRGKQCLLETLREPAADAA
jgi:hypothetical protein